MKRLTEWRGEHAAIVNHHENYIDRLAAYEDTGLEPGDIEIMKAANDEMRRSEESRVRLFYGTAIGIQAERCAEIVKAETDCRLVVLPCKVGDKVYTFYNGKNCKWPTNMKRGKIYETLVSGIRLHDWDADDWRLLLLFDTREASGCYEFSFSEVGKTVFLTSAEAEKAMEVTDDA